MKNLILICFLLLGLTGTAQKFSDVLTVGDTLDDGRIELEPKYYGIFVWNKDTVKIELAMSFDQKRKTVLVEGFYIFDKKPPLNYQFMFQNNFPVFKLYKKSVENFFTTDASVTIDNISQELKAIRKNGNVYLPVDASSYYVKMYTANFEKIICEWY